MIHEQALWAGVDGRWAGISTLEQGKQALPLVNIITPECHDFHLFTYFLLSPKRPNTHSNHDMALSFLIFPYLIFSHFKVTPSR